MVKSLRCGRCGLIRQESLRVEHPVDPVEDWCRDEDAEQATRICIWCGKICESIEALDLHEEECEP